MSGSKINVYWSRTNKGHGNFGDELNHYLVEKLSGKEVVHVAIPFHGFNYIKEALRGLFHGRYKWSQLPKLVRQFFPLKYVAVIGSVLGVLDSRLIKCDVWGCGIISRNDNIRTANFFAVRGPHSQARLKELGLTVPETIGDPALLLPLLYDKPQEKKIRVGVIPHHIHFDDFKSVDIPSDIVIIDLTEPIELIIDQIRSCTYTLSSSLHGLIVSHAYGVPSLWVKGNSSLMGDDVKFLDYFASVDIPNYEPLVYNDILKNRFEVNPIFDQYEGQSLIRVELDDMQKSLLKAAPFEVISDFL